MKHLAVFVGGAIEKILNGEKTIDARFSLNKISPYLMVKKGDEIYLKQSGGLIVGKVVVDNVLYYEGLDAEIIGKLRKEYYQEIAMGDDYWQSKANCRYASLIFLDKTERFLAPIKSNKHDRRAWVMLEND